MYVGKADEGEHQHSLGLKQRCDRFVEIVACRISIPRGSYRDAASRQEAKADSRDMGEKDHVCLPFGS